MHRKPERFFIFLITLVLGALFLTLYNTHQDGFADVNKRLNEGTMINLNGKNPGDAMKTLLQKGYYFEDKKDVAIIENAVSNGVKLFDGPIDNVGELNKRRFFVNADSVYDAGGKNFKERVEASRALLGYTGDDEQRFVQEKLKAPNLPAAKSFNSGAYQIDGKIVDKEKNPVSGVLVKLTMILPQDSGYVEMILFL